MIQIPEFVLGKRDEILTIAKKYGVREIRFRDYSPAPARCSCAVLKFYINEPQKWQHLTMAVELDQCLNVYVSVTNGDAMDKWYAEELAKKCPIL
jgi:hypothetical protein